jgi:hypothetical protein
MTIERVAPDFFTGVEVENSPAKGLRTLFVVGIQPVDTIIANVLNSKSRHVYIGANMSLHEVGNDDHDVWKSWDDMIEGVLESSAVDYVTIDLTSAQVEGFLESRASEDNRVIPMISVKLPYTRLLNYNTTIKIDDKGFNATNPGVWCHSLHNLMNRDTFTPWHAYVGDNPVN